MYKGSACWWYCALVTCEPVDIQENHYVFYVTEGKPNIFSMAQQPLVGQDLLTNENLRLHSDSPHSVGLLWTSDQPEAKTSTWQHTTRSREWHPCPAAGSEPAIPAKEQPQTHVLDRVAIAT